MAMTDAQKRANMKYQREKQDTITFRVPKGTRERYREMAEKKGQSFTRFLVNAIEYYGARDFK